MKEREGQNEGKLPDMGEKVVGVRAWGNRGADTRARTTSFPTPCPLHYLQNSLRFVGGGALLACFSSPPPSSLSLPRYKANIIVRRHE
jgi:hypothetical protein